MEENDLEVVDYFETPELPEQVLNTPVDLGMSPSSVLGSRRPSIDGMSSTCTSQSEVRSFKDRLREHVNQVKERASNTVVAKQTKPKAQQSIKQPAERLAQLMSSENQAVDAALEKHEKEKQGKNIIINDINEINHEIESYNFFTKVWDPPSRTQEVQRQSPELSDVENGVSNEENKKLVTEDYLGLTDGDDLDVIDQYLIPFLDTSINIKKAADKIYFIPDGSPVELAKRLNSKQPRYPENEGLYVGTYPPIYEKCLNKLQQRLLKSNEFHWFGEDGEPIRLPDPLASLSCCMLNDFEHSGYFEIKYTNAMPFMSPYSINSLSQDSNEIKFLLELEVSKIQFSHHSLFSRQHVLDKQLLQLFHKYKSRNDIARTKMLSGRLEALRNARDTLIKVMAEENDKDLLENHKNRLQRYKTEIKETRTQRLLEGKVDHSLISNILSTWRDLKKLRERQEYTVTSSKLEIIVNNNENSEEWEIEYNKLVEETIEELNEQNIEINIPKIRDQVFSVLSESLRSPGEPIVTFSMSKIEPTSEDRIISKEELQRRLMLSKYSIWFDVIFNGHIVCESTSLTIDDNFSVTFNQKFVVEIHQWPETLSLNIHCENLSTKNMFTKTPIAELYIPFPMSNSTLDVVDIENLEFSCFGNENFQNAGVGSGIDFKIFPEDTESQCLYTSGEVLCKAGWGSFGDKILCPPEDYFNKLYSRNINNVMPTKSDKFLHWMNDLHPDPNDPNNVSFFEALKSIDESTVCNMKEKFKVNIYKKMLEFCSDEELNSNTRLKLLKLRDRGEIEFRMAKPVPLKEWLIPKDIFKEFENRLSTSELALEVAGLGPLETSRIWGRYSVIKLYDKILKQCKLGNRNKITRDIIVEDTVPDIGTLGLTFMKMFQPKRPLRPKRKERKKIPAKSLSGQEIKVNINVMRAFEVPVRKNSDMMIGDIAMVPVQPFIEISFKNHTSRTTTAEGSNPTWNQDLQLTMKSNSVDFCPNEIQSIDDCIHINMYDEITIDILEDNRIRETNIHQRLERHWLGSCVIPISALFNSPQIEGTFQLNTPRHLLGYERFVSNSESSHYRNSTFLSLFIMAQPPLNPPEPIKEKLDCSELPNFERYLEYWSTEGAKQFPQRPVKTLVIHCSGKTVCVTRFFRPLPLPIISEDGQNTTIEMVVRFVSLIPVINSNVLLIGRFNVWMTGDQLLGSLFGGGSGVDHGILLCCYFMKLNVKAWLLLGTGVSCGEAAYVLTSRPHQENPVTTLYDIWDPLTGQKYSTVDSFSPIQEVHCLINVDNIWLNVQYEKSVTRTRWDVTQSRDWNPAFGRYQAAPTAAGSVQPDSVDYTPPAVADARLLQDKLETTLRNALMKWRVKSKTVWNRYCVTVLRKILPHLERETWNKDSVVLENNDYLAELQHLLVSHKMSGFPINRPYSNTEVLVEAIKSTGMHLNENPLVEFALAVYVHPYPNQVLSVWIYLASLQPRR